MNCVARNTGCLLTVGLYIVPDPVEELKHRKGSNACEQQGHQQN